MKRLQGYLIDRETGVGISGKAVSFENLAGAAITTATTYAQSVDSVTDADGKFEAWFELSPGPVNIQVDVSGTEVKVRKHDEMAQFGTVWSSDISRMGRAFPDGIVNGFLNGLGVSTPSGHTIRIATGAAIIEGHVFSIENGNMNIAGTANTNPAINPRLDLVTLRQYHEDAAGQDAGRQEVVVTLGSSSGVAPSTPTGADFTDFPLAVVSTAYNASSKTLHEDLRAYSGEPFIGHDQGGGIIVNTSGSYSETVCEPEVTGLNPNKVYDGFVNFHSPVMIGATTGGEYQTWLRFDDDHVHGPAGVNVEIPAYIHQILREGDANSIGHTATSFIEVTRPVIGVSGVSEFSVPIKLRFVLPSIATIEIGTESYGYLLLKER